MGQASVQVGYAWMERQCVEESKNRGRCIDEIHRKYSGIVNRDPYCAKWGWVVTDEAATIAGIPNILPKTAGALDLLQRADRTAGIEVDTTPAVGCLGYRRSSAPTASGHIVLVVKIDASGIHTIEGNAVGILNGIKVEGVIPYHYTWEEVAASQNNFQFIHTERMPGARLLTPQVAAPTTKPSSIGPVLLFGAAGLTVLLATRD